MGKADDESINCMNENAIMTSFQLSVNVDFHLQQNNIIFYSLKKTYFLVNLMARKKLSVVEKHNFLATNFLICEQKYFAGVNTDIKNLIHLKNKKKNKISRL